ncbi:unnamed protein product [Mucor fragilis]
MKQLSTSGLTSFSKTQLNQHSLCLMICHPKARCHSKMSDVLLPDSVSIVISAGRSTPYPIGLCNVSGNFSVKPNLTATRSITKILGYNIGLRSQFDSDDKDEFLARDLANNLKKDQKYCRTLLQYNASNGRHEDGCSSKISCHRQYSHYLQRHPKHPEVLVSTAKSSKLDRAFSNYLDIFDD